MVARKKKWGGKSSNLEILQSLGFKGSGLLDEQATNFLRSNPELIARYEKARRQYEGQEDFKADKARQLQLSDAEALGGYGAGGGAISTFTGRAISKKEYEKELMELGDLPKRIMDLEDKISKGLNVEASQRLLEVARGELSALRARAVSSVLSQDKRAGGQIALTSEEKAFRAAGYTGVFDDSATRWLELQDENTQMKFSQEVTNNRVLRQAWEQDTIDKYGGLLSYMNPELVDKASVSYDRAKGESAEAIGSAFKNLDWLKYGKLGFDVAKIYKGLTASKVATSGIGKAINAWGAENLGLANVDKSFIGPLQPGQTAGTTLTGVFSAAATGAAVGQVGSMVFGTHSTGSTIGGAVGGAVGSVVPGIGTFVGSVIGATIGGSFGSDPRPFSDFTGVYDGDSLGYQVGAKHMSDTLGREMGQLANNYIQEVERTTGIDMSGFGIAGGYSFTEKGYYVRSGYWRNPDGGIRDSMSSYEKRATFNPDDASTIFSAYNDIIVDHIAKGSNEVRDLVNKGYKSDAILSALQARNAKIVGDKIVTDGGTKSGDEVLTEPVKPTDSPKVKVSKKAVIAQKQVDDYLAAVEEGTIGIAGTIKTSRRGVLSEVPTIKRRLLAA